MCEVLPSPLCGKENWIQCGSALRLHDEGVWRKQKYPNWTLTAALFTMANSCSCWFVAVLVLAEVGSSSRPQLRELADKAYSPADFDAVEVWPTRPPTKKEAADSGASLEDAMQMPWFPRHDIMCANGTRLCRPGEGNTKNYRFWGQPYIHRESYVQSRLRRPPHEPNPNVEYARLCSLARKVAIDNLVIVAAADWDWRRIILNFLLHAHRLGYHNALVLSMDTELHVELRRRGLHSFDDSQNLDAWNVTCLQRHVQRVRTERILAVAALMASGVDVLLCDATVVFVRDVLPVLRALPPGVDMVGQRHECPPPVQKSTGSGVNPGFLYLRATQSEAMVAFLQDAIQRGLVEFYHRWVRHRSLP